MVSSHLVNSTVIVKLTKSRGRNLPPHTPKENGVVECKMHIIGEMAKSMMKGKDLPKIFWAKAYNTIVYILNRSYTKGVNRMTPLQAFSSKKPSTTHFRVFGCDRFMHVPDANRTKSEPKS